MRKAVDFVPPFLRSPYNYDMSVVSDETGLKCEDATLTKQSFLEETDINEIVRRFNVTGQLPQNVVAPSYVEFEEVFDFQSAMNAVRHAAEAFMKMPADVRSRFSNDPQLFLEFCNDEKNFDEAVKLGLVLPEAVERRAQAFKAKADAEAAEAAADAQAAGAVAAAKGA